jgi:hypothetical protein
LLPTSPGDTKLLEIAGVELVGFAKHEVIGDEQHFGLLDLVRLDFTFRFLPWASAGTRYIHGFKRRQVLLVIRDSIIVIRRPFNYLEWNVKRP